ncbi:hypothetical protein ACGFX8_34485 [Streptomyces sp. NPDC048362]|uniref:hypothetical protein n=1 Tax=Streptomyces sp. NPDC048362 TaxID=3365539 RepID=UPI003719F895
MDIVKRHGEPWIKLSPLGKQEESQNLVALKAEIKRRWGTIDLLDILKEAELATGFTGEFTSVATREAVPKAVLRRRLLLVLCALVILSRPKGVLDVEQAQTRPRFLPDGCGYLPPSITQIPRRSDARTACGDALLAG